MRRRVGWLIVLAALLITGGSFFRFLKGFVLEDRQEPLPSFDERSPGPPQTALDFTVAPLLGGPRPDASWESLSSLLDQFPETHFQWKAGKPGVALVTLPGFPKEDETPGEERSKKSFIARLIHKAQDRNSFDSTGGLGKTRLPALVAGEGTVYEWTGVVPSSASMEFCTGVLSSGPEVHFRLDLVESAGEFPLFFSQTDFTGVSPSSVPSHSWHSARVDLSPWAGRPVRIRMRVEAPPDQSGSRPWVGFWGAPRLWSPVPERPFLKRRGRPSKPESSVVLSVLETTPDLGGESPHLDVVLRESVSFSRFYTSDVRSTQAFQALFSTGTEGPSRFAWPRLLGEKGYRTLAVGAFSEDMMETLSQAGFDEIHQLSHTGYDSLLAGRRVMNWARDRERGPVLILVYFRDLPRYRLPPLRFWITALRALPWSTFRMGRWKRTMESAYMDESVGRLAETLNEDPQFPLYALVSLKGAVLDPTPVRWPRTGRQGNVFLNERGWGLRESEIRTLFAVRQGDRWLPGLCRSVGQGADVGPTLLTALGVSPGSRKGPPWNLETASLSEESNGVWVFHSPWAKAINLDGRYKYILHGPSAMRSDLFGRPVEIDFPAEEIFDLWTDPGEHRNLTHSRRHLLARVREVMAEADPTPVDIRLSFLNPTGTVIESVVTCSAGSISSVRGTVPLVRGGSYQFSFSTSALAGEVTFRTWPPQSSYSMRLLSNRRPLSSDQILVSRWGLPLFESVKKEWIDKTEFGWMDGWAPPVPSSGPSASLGRVSAPWESNPTSGEAR